MPSPGVGLRAWVPSPTLKGILGFCRPGVYFLPATPSSNLLLCVDVLPPSTEVGVLFVSPVFVCHFCMSGAEGMCPSVILGSLFNGKYSCVL